MDKNKPDRVVFSQMLYLLHFEEYDTFLRINSSFEAQEKNREFRFSYLNGDGERRHILISFDTPEGVDRITVTDTYGDVLYLEEYPSLNKLKRQVKEVFNYFSTSELRDLATIDDDETILDLYEEVRRLASVIGHRLTNTMSFTQTEIL